MMFWTSHEFHMLVEFRLHVHWERLSPWPDLERPARFPWVSLNSYQASVVIIDSIPLIYSENQWAGVMYMPWCQYRADMEVVSFSNIYLYILMYTNADLKISLYVCVHIKTIQWKFCMFNPKNSWVI